MSTPSGGHGDSYISTYIDKTAGIVSTPLSVHGLPEATNLVNETAGEILNEFSSAGIYCYRDRQTGEVTSMATKIHNYGGGFAVTKRQRILPGQEFDARSMFSHSEITNIENGILHRFKYRETILDSSPAMAAALPNEGMEEGHSPAPIHSDCPLDPTPAIVQAGQRIYIRRLQRTKKKEVKLSDKEKLAETLEIQRHKLVLLSGESVDNPHLRLYHVHRKGRTFAYATAFLQSERGPKAILSVLWETRTNPRRAVTVTFSIPDTSAAMVAHCSCDYLITQSKGSVPNCYHAQTLFDNQDFVDYVKRQILRRQERPQASLERCIFGEEINLCRIRDSSPYLTALLRRSEKTRQNITKPWLFMMVLDVRLQLFVPVVKSAIKPLECLGCRMSSVMGGNCCHVDACISACRRLRQSGGWYRFLQHLNLLSATACSDDDTDFEDEEDESDYDSDRDTGANRSVSVPESYFPTGIRRPIMPCKGEQHMMKKLARMLDMVPPGETLSLDEKGNVSCPKCNAQNTEPLRACYRREVTLFTLTQGTPTIYVYDWHCNRCQERRMFSGKTWAVFPAFRHSCYTTELMYIALEMTCLHALSFRTAYRITRIFDRTPSISRKQKNSRKDDLNNYSTPSRRRMNDAFAAFVDHLDTSSPSVTNMLFSCENCEIPVSTDECEELGINPDEAADVKRLKAVVIDGTAAGILTKLPDYDRHTAIVPPAEGGFGSVQLIRQKQHRKALAALFDVWKESLRQWKQKSSTSALGLGSALDYGLLRFWIRNPTKAKIPGVVCTKTLLRERDSQFSQLFIDEEACFCPIDLPRLTSQHWDDCEDVRGKFHQPLLSSRHSVGIIDNIRMLLKQLFTVHQYVVPGPTAQIQHEGADQPVQTENHDEGNNEEEERSPDEDNAEDEPLRVRHGTVSGAWIQLHIANENTSPLFLDSVIALLHFLLFEHVALPYVGRISSTLQTQRSSNGSEQQSEAFPPHQDVDNNRMQTAETTRPDAGNVIDSVDGSDSDNSSNHDEELPPMLSYAKKSMDLHVSLFEKMERYTSCLHFQENGRIQQQPRECECVKDLKLATVSINEVSPILGAFCQEFLKINRPLTIGHSSFVNSLLDIMRKHMEEAREFFIALGNSLPEECEEYWTLYNAPTPPAIPLNDSNNLETTQSNEGRDQNGTEGSQQEQHQVTHDGSTQHDNHVANITTNTRQQENQNHAVNIDTNTEQHQNQDQIPGNNVTRMNITSDIDQPENATHTNHLSDYHRRTRGNEGNQNHSHDQSRSNENSISSSQQIEVEESITSNTSELEDAKSSGICFPGRRSCRPSIVFKGKDLSNCSKQYKTSRSHTPGLLTVQCSCDAPKLLGFVIMTQAESTALALSSILTHFAIPPRTVFYDNACNLFTSVLIRVPWLLGKTRLAVDRFHYKSHKCCAYFNPDSYRQYDMQRTETAESINARIEKGLKTIRYIKGEKLMQFLRARFSLLNVAATFKQRYTRTDIEDEDLNTFFQSLVPCTCDLCQEAELDTIVAEENVSVQNDDKKEN